MNSACLAALVTLLVVAMLSGAQGATPAPVPPGSEACGVELTAYQPTLLNKIYVAPAMAQGFRVYDRSRIFSFTSSFFTVAANNGSALISAEIYPDASDNGTATVPAAAPLPNGSFAVDAVAPFVAEADVLRGTLQARTFPAAQAEDGGITLQPGHYWLVVRLPSSMGWGINAPAPRDPYQPLVLTSLALWEPAWNYTLHHTALVTFGGCYIVRPSPSPSPSASPSRAPAVMPITAGVTAGFGTDQASVNVSAPTGSSGGGGSATVTTVTAALAQLLGNNGSSLPIEAVTLTETNATVPGQSATYAYAAQIDPVTLLEQSYTFHEKPRAADFEGLAFTLNPGTVKWSINLTTTTEPGAGVGQAGLTFEYRLAGVVTAGDGAAVPARGFLATAKSDSPRTRMTSYFLPLSTTIVAQLQVFDVALLDGALVPIQHRVKLVTTTPDQPQPTLRRAVADGGEVVEETAAYVLELTFPPFNRSLYYDPSLGLGVLLGAPGGKGSGDDSGALVIGVAVAVPLAILFVLTVVVVGFALIYWQKRRSARNLRHRLDTVHSRSLTKPGDDL